MLLKKLSVVRHGSNMSDNPQYHREGGSILNKVENRHSVAHGREKVGTIWAEDQIAPAIDSSEEVGELNAKSVRVGHRNISCGLCAP